MRIMLSLIVICLVSFNLQQAYSQNTPAATPPAKNSGQEKAEAKTEFILDKYEKEILAFEKQDQESPPAKNGILFVGSSSIRLWPVKKSFPNREIIHRGFGGSTTVELNYYFDRIVKPYDPKIIVYYEGDNDIGRKSSPEEIMKQTQIFIDRVHKLWPETTILYIPIKPSIKRWAMWPQIQETHKLAQSIASKDKQFIYLDIVTPMLIDNKPDPTIFKEDGLHLNDKGYVLWTKIVEDEISKIQK